MKARFKFWRFVLKIKLESIMHKDRKNKKCKHFPKLYIIIINL